MSDPNNPDWSKRETRSYAYDSLDRLTFAGVTTSTGFVENRYYTYDQLGNILTARVQLPSVVPAQGVFANGLASSSSSYSSRGSFNPLSGQGQTTSGYQGKAFLPFDLGFQPVTAGPGGDTTTLYSYPAAQAARPHAVSQTCKKDTSAGSCTATPNTYTYDANGNMTQRVEDGVTWTQVFDAGIG